MAKIHYQDIKIKITELQAKAILKLYEIHVKQDLPMLCAMLGVDVTKNKDYQKLLKEFENGNGI